MMIKDPVRLYGDSILPLMIKKTGVRCLDCYAEVSAKVQVHLAGTKQYLFFFFSMNRT